MQETDLPQKSFKYPDSDFAPCLNTVFSEIPNRNSQHFNQVPPGMGYFFIVKPFRENPATRTQ
jgi:hypothetical protein